MSCSAMALNSNMMAAMGAPGTAPSPSGNIATNLGAPAPFATFGGAPSQPSTTVAGPRLDVIR